MTVIDLVIERLGFATNAALARFLGIDRAAIGEWRKRLKGGIPSKHWGALLDEAKIRNVALTIDELRGAQ